MTSKVFINPRSNLTRPGATTARAISCICISLRLILQQLQRCGRVHVYYVVLFTHFFTLNSSTTTALGPYACVLCLFCLRISLRLILQQLQRWARVHVHYVVLFTPFFTFNSSTTTALGPCACVLCCFVYAFLYV